MTCIVIDSSSIGSMLSAAGDGLGNSTTLGTLLGTRALIFSPC
jgi:hypothetical protein